ncbi:hypothetical protein [Aetokthonos hydrillicola]|jgi:hypothetical protein|nr:hypothetical protein [Aetokthonos hydrillicola]
MSKFQKSNKEAKKAKKQSDGTNKQKKDPNRRDGFVTRISKEFNN